MVDDDRIRAALARFDEVFQKLTPQEQQQLVRLCVDRVDVCAQSKPVAGADPADRQFRVRLKLPVTRHLRIPLERIDVLSVGTMGNEADFTASLGRGRAGWAPTVPTYSSRHRSTQRQHLRTHS